MQRWPGKIFLLIAVLTIIGHNAMPHLHHEEEHEHAIEHDHHDEDKDHQNIFSFGELDEDFLPAKVQVVKTSLPILFIPVHFVTEKVRLQKIPKAVVGDYHEHPPPGNHPPNLFSRPPPIC